MARKEGIDAESALRASTAKFRSRWGAMEDVAYERGVALEGLSTGELNELWDAVKLKEGSAADEGASPDAVRA